MKAETEETANQLQLLALINFIRDDGYYRPTDSNIETLEKFYEVHGRGVRNSLSSSPEKQESQEELWKEVGKEINEEGLWLYEDWDGFKITEKGIQYLQKQFNITRK